MKRPFPLLRSPSHVTPFGTADMPTVGHQISHQSRPERTADPPSKSHAMQAPQECNVPLLPCRSTPYRALNISAPAADVVCRRKQSKADREEEEAAAARARGEEGDQTGNDTDDDGLSSTAGLSALSSLAQRNHLSVQELGVRD